MLTLFHWCTNVANFLPKLCIDFVRSESVSLRAYTNRQSTPRAQFVCPCSLFSVYCLAAIVRPVVACNISKGSSRPSTIIDDSNNFAPVLPFGQLPRLASPRQVGGRSLYFSGSLRSFGVSRAKLTDYCTTLTIAPREDIKPDGAKWHYIVASSSWRSTTGAPIVFV